MKQSLTTTKLPVFNIQCWAEIQKSRGGSGQAISWMDWQRLGSFLAGEWPVPPPPIMFFDVEPEDVQDRSD